MEQDIWFGKYEVIQILGEGAASRVCLARHIVLGQVRAIKCIERSRVSYEQMKQEACMLLSLKSPLIPEVYDVEEDEEYLYIIEEYMEGESLVSYKNREKELTEAVVIDLSIQVCELINYLHTRKVPILYLDLKPSNLRIHNGHLKLVDFGSAKRLDGQASVFVTGTRGYAAPEQYRGDTVSESTDVYGIGMLMYYLMTGTIMRKGADLPSCNAIYGYSKMLIKIVESAVRHDPTRRKSSVESLLKSLSRLKKRKQELSAGRKPSMTIALAGTEHRVGVTHMAWYLLREIKRQKHTIIYMECSESNVVYILAKECRNSTDNRIRYRGLEMTRQEWIKSHELLSYEYIIKDYGCLAGDNVTEFLKADLCIVVCGGRLWERSKAAKAVRILSACGQDWAEKVIFVYNHLTAEEYYHAPRIKGIRRSDRMPDDCDALGGSSVLVYELVKRIIE